MTDGELERIRGWLTSETRPPDDEVFEAIGNLLAEVDRLRAELKLVHERIDSWLETDR